MIAEPKEGTGLKKLDLLEPKLKALVEECDSLRARAKELEKDSQKRSEKEPPEHLKLLQERKAIREKLESLLGTLRGFRRQG
jgi:FtsZ-binding cell division protein ZapB